VWCLDAARVLGPTHTQQQDAAVPCPLPSVLALEWGMPATGRRHSRGGRLRPTRPAAGVGRAATAAAVGGKGVTDEVDAGQLLQEYCGLLRTLLALQQHAPEGVGPLRSLLRALRVSYGGSLGDTDVAVWGLARVSGSLFPFLLLVGSGSKLKFLKYFQFH
jgi:hypothetical protein